MVSSGNKSSIKDTLLNTSISRRSLVGTGAALSAAIYAGGAMPGTFGRTVLAQDGGTEFHTAWPYEAPPDGHFNPFVDKGILVLPNIYGDLMYVPMGMLYWADNEWLPLLATEWTFMSGGQPLALGEATPEGATAVASPVANAVDGFQVKLREGVMWSDDQPFTAKDVVNHFDILWLRSNTVWQYIDEVEAVDDYTVNFHIIKPALTIERYVIRQEPTPSAIFGEFGQMARDLRTSGKTTSDPEGLQLIDQFNQFRPETIIVNGPYTIDIPSITGSQFDMPKNPKSFYADMAKFDKIVNFNGETDTISAVVLAKDVDYATQGFAPATEAEFGKTGIRVLRPPTYSGAALIFNFGSNPEFADKKVRQALAYAIDRPQCGTVSLADSGIGVTYMAGFSDTRLPFWMEQADIDSLEKYELNLETATSLLTEAGWSKDGETWKKPDGSDASYELSFPAEFADYSATGANVAEQLNAFGIQVAATPVTFTQIGPDIDQGKFQMAIQGWGSSTNPHPTFSFQTAYFTHNTLAKNNGGKGMDFPLNQSTDIAGDVDLNALVVDCAQGMDESLQKEQVTTIAKVFNELLNMIPLYERLGNNAALEGVRVAAWPKDDDRILLNSPYADGIPTMLILTGALEPFVG